VTIVERGAIRIRFANFTDLFKFAEKQRQQQGVEVGALAREMPSLSAVSSSGRPAKYRSFTKLALSGNLASNRSKAS